MDKTGPLEYLYVLRRGDQRHRQRLGELADGQLTVGEPAEHAAPSAVGQRVKHLVQPGHILNHVVNDMQRTPRL
jgi:hypothetical protein